MYCLAAAPSKVGTLDGPVELETEEAGCSGTEAGADGAGAGEDSGCSGAGAGADGAGAGADGAGAGADSGCSGAGGAGAEAEGAGAGVAGEEAGQFVCSGPHEVMVTTVEDSTVWVRRAAALVETITAANETRVENCIVI